MTKPFAWPNPDAPSKKLCARCAKLSVDKDPIYYEFSKEEISNYGLRFFNWYRSDQLILAQDRIVNLSQSEACPLCQLIIAAVREQYRCTNESVASDHVYALLSRYVPLGFRRHEQGDTPFIRYLEVVSPANSDIEASTVHTNGFHISDQQASRDTLRSILAPVTSSKSTPKYLHAKVLEDQLDFNLLQGWLRRCEELHGKNCTDTSLGVKDTLPSPSFMVIDTQEMHLTQPAPGSRHATLSYCWGPKGKNSFLTTVSNVSSLREPGGLSQVWNQLPATIQDAILLAQKIGERFLWIDSLCIVQDDAKSVKDNIDSMKRVYAEAALTIIAASGEDATAGLPGVRPGTRSHGQRIRSLGPGCRYVLVEDLELALTQCPWVKRGWTYQEWFLSSKCLVFVNDFVMFSCYQDTWREDIAGESERPQIQENLGHAISAQDTEPPRRSLLRRMFGRSSKRSENTASTDKGLDSPAKVSLQKHKDPNDNLSESKLQDLPLNDVDFSYVTLGYELRPGRRHGLVTDFRREPTDVFMMTLREYLKRELRYASDRLNAYQGIVDYYATAFGTSAFVGTLAKFSDWAMVMNIHGERRDSFPSWSWSGWSGVPTWLMQNEVFKWMDYSCWIVWHYRGQEPETITPVKRELVVVYDATNAVTAESLKVSDEEDWKDLGSFASMIEWFIFKKGWKREATRTRLPDGPLCRASILAARGFAQFWTLVLPVTFETPVPRKKIKLFDREGIACGEVRVDQATVNGATPELYEVIALSEANWCRGAKWSYVIHHEQSARAHDVDDVVDGMFNVMLIGWIQGIAERIGIGMVGKEVITYSPKEELAWKEIVLA